MKRIICIYLLLSSVNLYAMTRQDIKTQIRALLQDESADTTKQRWSDVSISSRINIAQLDIAVRTRCCEKTATYNIANDTYAYLLPSDLIDIRRVSHSSTTLIEYDIEALDSLSDTWELVAKSTPSKYYIINSTLVVIPTPNYNGTNYLKVIYWCIPSELSSDNAVPLNSEIRLYPYHTLIIYYVMAWCKLDDYKFNEADYFFKKYNEGLSQMVQELKIRTNMVTGGSK